MHKLSLGLFLLTLGCAAGETSSARGGAAVLAAENARPPLAAVRPTRLEAHGDVRVDDYYWLRERENPDVIAYLEAENAYTQAVMAHTQELRETLFEEIKGRLKQDDSSVPYKLDDHYYYSRFVEGGDYPLHCRKRGALDAAEEVMLDVNAMAAGHGYFAVGRRAVSPSQTLLAYPVDVVGRRIYTIRVKDLASGETLADAVPDVTGNVAWANDSKTLFYARQDPVTLRSYQIWRHELGTDPAQDVLVYEEQDDTFDCSVFRTRSKRFLMIASTHTLSSEYRYLDADDPTGEFRVFLARERGHEYDLDHYADHFYVRTNDGARNFRLARVPVAAPARESWEEVLPHREDTLLEDFLPFQDHLVAVERRAGLLQLHVIPWSGEGEHYVAFDEPAYEAGPTDNHEFATSVLRFGYSSMKTPDSVYDYDMRTRERTLLKRDEVLGGFDPDDYVAERAYATARDGVRVPLSIVYHAGLERDGGNPLLLYGYGSYGASMDASFNADRLRGCRKTPRTSSCFSRARPM